MNAVELQQMGGCRGPALDLVDVRDVEAVASAWVTLGARDGAKGSPEGEAPHAPHTVDAYAHDFPLNRKLAAVAKLVDTGFEGHSLQRAKGQADEQLQPAPDHAVKLIE